MLTTMQRLAKARELSVVGAFADMAANDVKRQVLLKRRAEGLRAVLLGRRAVDIADLDLFDREGTAEAISAHMDGLNDAPLEVQGRAAAYLSIVAEYVDATSRAAGGPVLGNSAAMPDLIRRLHSLREYAKTEGYRAATFQGFRDAGQGVYRYRTRAEGIAADLAELDKEAVAVQRRRADEYHAEVERRVAILEPMKAAYFEADDAYYRFMHEMMREDAIAGVPPDEVLRREDERQRLRDVKGALRDAYNAKHDELLSGFTIDSVPDPLRPRREALQASFAAVGKRFISEALDQSPITEEQATAWADAQEISPSGRAKLRKLGYDPKQVRQDMAEFYRLSGGRLAAVKIRASRGRRASAEEIHGPKTSIINLGQAFSKRTLFHELAHHVEADPVALAAARGFLEARRESRQLHTLRSLTGNRGYGPKEVAFKDKWFSEYIGRHYEHRGQVDATEVFSMGLESFSDPEMLARRVSMDAEHFALMLGFLKTPPDPMFGSVKKVFRQIGDAQAEVEEVGEEVRAESIRRLAAGVVLVPRDPPPSPAQRPDRLYHASDYDYLGSFGPIDVWHTKDKVLTKWVNNRRKRLSGYVLGKYDGPGGEQDRGWRGPFSEKVVFGDLQEALAVARAWASGDGNPSLDTPDAAKQWADRIEAAQAASQP